MITIEFIGPCTVRPLLETKVLRAHTKNVGSLTIETLEKFEVEFKGTEQGLNSAFNTPIGLDAMEVISDNEMNSYGWCYSVDGKSPEVYPDQIPLTETMKNITWFFAYAHFKNGEWISQCEPAFKRKPEFLCAKD